MAVLIDKSTRLIVQGLTGREGTFHAKAAQAYGTNVVGVFTDAARKAVQDAAVKQNITTLHNRVNELGVAEPVIQQQGADRIVVQLPGVQDTAKAKDIIGRTATLELRMVDDGAEALEALKGSGPVPFGTERFIDRGFGPIIVKRQVVLTGDRPLVRLLAEPSLASYQICNSNSRSTPNWAVTFSRASSISASTSADLAPGCVTMKLAWRSLISAPPTRVPLRPACSMSCPAR